MSKIPEPWATRLVAKGFTDGRSSRSDAPSLGALATKIGVNTTTITEAITGRRKPKVETVRALVAELGPDVADWLNVKLLGPYEPPAEADLLTPRQRDAVTELIRSIVAADQGGAEDDQRPAPTSPAPSDLGAARRRRGPAQQIGQAARDD